MVSVCRKCYLPGKRSKNSAKSMRSADMHILTKIARESKEKAIDFIENVYPWDVWRVSHAFKDMTKNINHHATHSKYMTRLRRKFKNKKFFY
ncbi:MAG: hypothetical protein ACTSQP_18110 [Promethearchaeota archaeon]